MYEESQKVPPPSSPSTKPKMGVGLGSLTGFGGGISSSTNINNKECNKA